MRASALLLAALLAATPAWASPRAPLPFQPVLVGEATLRFIGLRIYDSRLWAPTPDWRADAPFALELDYARSFSGATIAERSLDEIRGQRALDDATANRWLAILKNLFPDVQAGDTLVGVRTPGQGARFYAGPHYLGAIDDEALASAFFDIWLGPRTSEPALRRELLGVK